MSAASPIRVEDLLSRLPGTVRRGNTLAVPEEGGASRLSTGHPEVDALLGGGLPRGRLTEMVGAGSVGITSLAQHLLACTTGAGHFAAWVDLANAFDPTSAEAAGVSLDRLLWVRPPDAVAAFAATEILLATGGFALVFLDTAGVGDPAAGGWRSGQGRRPGSRRQGRAQQSEGRRMIAAAQTWLRLARAAARSHTSLVVLPGATGGEPGGLAGTAAGLRLEFSSVHPIWQGASGAPALLEGLEARIDVVRHRGRGTVGARSRRAHLRLG